MITRMKKLTALVYHNEYDAFLLKVREFAQVHVIEKQRGVMDADLQEFVQKHNENKSLLANMKIALGDEEPNEVSTATLTIKEIKETFTTLCDAKQEVTQRIALLGNDIAIMSEWGSFNRVTVEGIRKAGWNVDFFACPEKDYDKEWEETLNAIPVKEEKDTIYFVTFSLEPVHIKIEPLHMPASSLSELETQKEEAEKELVQIDEELKGFAKANYPAVVNSDLQEEDEIDLKRVKLNSAQAAEGTVVVLEGWFPADSEKEMKALLNESGVYYQIRKATKDEDVPIKLKNNKLSRLYEVITGMYGMPDYSEFDPTPLLAPFFTLFFAFCVGDAGYGLVLLALGLYLRKKLGPAMRGVMNLVMVLGAATTILGAIFGSFFGISLMEANIPWLESAKQFMVSSDKLMYVSLAIGVVHILFAMTVKAASSTLRFGFLESLNDWSWLFLVFGSVVTGGLMYLEKISSDDATLIFIIIGAVSALGIFLFNNIHRNVFVNVGAGLWNTYNMATGLMGDILSYIRLYALGLAGAMLGMVFNQLAFMIDIEVPIIGIVITWILRCLILVFGHTLNIAMSCLSAFVHPLRLTFVEYFKNSGYNGTGKAYSPFARAGKSKQ